MHPHTAPFAGTEVNVVQPDTQPTDHLQRPCRLEQCPTHLGAIAHDQRTRVGDRRDEVGKLARVLDTMVERLRDDAQRLAEWPADTAFVVYCAGPHCNGANRAAVRGVSTQQVAMTLGVEIIKILRGLGDADFLIKITYVVLLAVVGSSMLLNPKSRR